VLALILWRSFPSSIDARHLWIRERVQEAFGIPPGGDAAAEMDAFFEKEKHALVVEHFLMANGLPALVFMYQLPAPLPTNDPQGRILLDQELSTFLEMLKFEEDKLQAARKCFLDHGVLSYTVAKELDEEEWKELGLTNQARIKILRSLPTWEMPPPRPILSMNYSQGHSITGQKLVYLVRISKGEGSKAVSDTQPEQDVLYGEMSGDPTLSFGLYLQDVCHPLLKAVERADWGRLPTDKTDAFLATVHEAGESVIEAADTMSMGLQLEMPDAIYTENDVKKRSLEGFSEDAVMVESFEKLVTKWSKQVETFLREQAQAIPVDKKDPGPRVEIRHWQRRLDSVSAVINQLRQIPSKVVFGTLKHASKISKVLQDWRVVHTTLTDAQHEARNTRNYLLQLGPHVESFYEGDMVAMIEDIPALLQGISRNFNAGLTPINTDSRRSTISNPL